MRALREAALALALGLGYLFAATALSVVAEGPRGALLLALGGAALGACAGMRAPATILAVDLLAALFLAHRAPWNTPLWIALRYPLALAATRSRPPPLALRRAVLGAAALLGVAFAAELGNVLAQSRGDPPRAVDTALVLGFGLLRGGAVSPVLRARVARAVALHREGLARRLLFTGGVGAHRPAESVAARDVARAMGVPESDLLLEDRSHTTRENMTEAARVLRARGIARGPVAVVSDTFHLARARRLARDAGLDPVMVAAVTPAWTDRRRAAWWALREAALLVLDDAQRVTGAGR